MVSINRLTKIVAFSEKPQDFFKKMRRGHFFLPIYHFFRHLTSFLHVDHWFCLSGNDEIDSPSNMTFCNIYFIQCNIWKIKFDKINKK